MVEFKIGINDCNIRADRFLVKAMNVPSALIYKAFRKKDVKINGKHIKEDYILQENEILRIYVKEELRIEKTVPHCRLTAKIVYEDDNIIIFDKPSELACQPDSQHKSGTLVDMLKSYLFDKGEFCPENENSFSPALCNRLDTNTTGLVIGAKNAASLREMNEQIKLRNVQKYYICSVEGTLAKKHGNVHTYIEKNEYQNISTISDKGKEISMEYTVLSEKDNASEVEVLLHSGRSHQIRAYFSSVGCPIKGDKKYGAKSGGGQKLRAYKLKFDFGKDYKGVLSYLNFKEFKI